MTTWPDFDEEQVEAAAAVLRSGRVNYWTGELGRTFERAYAAAIGRRHAVALANGTLALELALKVLDIGAGDEVVVTPRSFIASASCVVTAGARPVFADVDRVSQTITAETIRPVLTSKTKAIIAVHLGGWPCDMDPIVELAEERGLAIIEDCAQAHGATYRGRPVGAIGDVAALSFCQDKIITTGGEGGMMLIDDERLWKRGWSYKDHGKSYDAVHHDDHPPGFRWLHHSVGSNWRMTEFQAAIGLIQLGRLTEWIERRRHHAAMFDHAFKALPALRTTEPPPDIGHAYYRYYAFVRPERLREGWNRDRIMQAIAAAGVPCFSGSCAEIYRERAFDFAGGRPEQRLPVARELGETSLAFLVHPTLLDDDICRAIDVASEVLAKAMR